MVVGQEGMGVGEVNREEERGLEREGVRKGGRQRGNYMQGYFKSNFTGTAGRVFRY